MTWDDVREAPLARNWKMIAGIAGLSALILGAAAARVLILEKPAAEEGALVPGNPASGKLATGLPASGLPASGLPAAGLPGSGRPRSGGPHDGVCEALARWSAASALQLGPVARASCSARLPRI